MTGNEILTWEAIAQLLYDADENLLHDRIAILPDGADDMYGDTKIIRPEMAKGEPLKGTVVRLGTGEDIPTEIEEGTRVQYNKYNVVKFEFTLDTGEKFSLVVLHVRDIYWYSNG